MSCSRETASLANGLRALEALATLAPVDPGGFARDIGLGPVKAVELLETFEAIGYARRVPGGAFFVLTRLALNLVESPSLAGCLVSNAIEPIAEFGDRIGHVVALNLPSGDDLTCYAVSRCCSAAGVSPGLRRAWPEARTDPAPKELTAAICLGRKPIALLVIHCLPPLIPRQRTILQRQLQLLADQLAGELRMMADLIPGSIGRKAASSPAISASLH